MADPIRFQKPDRNQWLRPTPEYRSNIPQVLREQRRWLVWALDGGGNKVPYPAEGRRPKNGCDANKPTNWRTFEAACATFDAGKHGDDGIEYALGLLPDGQTVSGVDLDGCRDPRTGHVEPWAIGLIDYFNSYTEVSPSGTGFKIFIRGSLPEDAKQGKRYKVELYSHSRPFTVTGCHVPSTPTTVEDREPQLRTLHAQLWSKDIIAYCRIFGLNPVQSGPNKHDIDCPWAEDHSTPSAKRDCSVFTDPATGEATGFHCFHGSHSESKSLYDLLKFFKLTGDIDERGFRLGKGGTPVPNHTDNIRIALDQLGYSLFYDEFSHRRFARVTGEEEPVEWTEDQERAVRYQIEEQFRFLPDKTVFEDACKHFAFKVPAHPVREYLDSREWDHTPRIDRWLTTYGGADDTALNRAIGRLLLVAAVRRVRRPGCKFDELAVFESLQGYFKSTALRTLCPKDEWFSDDLPLNVDSKQVIERTQGRWIIEASELSGMPAADVEKLKGMLSRQEDIARKAYGRDPVSVKRQFIIVATTNRRDYLKDSTGNRRFWPVEIRRPFDVEALKRDRDQLWAEAAAREAEGESIRLDPSLWAEAKQQQDGRVEDNPWIDKLRPLLFADDDFALLWPGCVLPPDGMPLRDRIPVSNIHDALGLQASQAADMRVRGQINRAMRHFGFESLPNFLGPYVCPNTTEAEKEADRGTRCRRYVWRGGAGAVRGRE